MNFAQRLQSDWNRAQFTLRERYWGNWKLRSDAPPVRPDPREIALYRGVLERILPAEIRGTTDRVVDVGCRNWSYLPALAETFPKAEFVGVEVDARRRYWNLFRRMDLAEANAASLRQKGREARCIFADFRALDGSLFNQGELTIFTFLFPYVSPDPCLKGGLPTPYSSFEELVQKAGELGSRISRRSALLSLHQGSWEGEIAASAYLKYPNKTKHLELRSEELSQLSTGIVFPYDLQAFVRIS